MFGTDETWRGGTTSTCDCCGREARRTWCMVTREGEPYALYFASCYDHETVRESWIDVVFGTWHSDTAPGADEHTAAFDDHVTFGCRFGPVEDSDRPAVTAVDAAALAPESDLFGVKLGREEALLHPRLVEFWQVLDYVVEADPLVHEHHYHPLPAR